MHSTCTTPLSTLAATTSRRFQQPGHLGLPGNLGEVERGAAVLVHGVDVGPALDQGVDGGGVNVGRGMVQRRVLLRIVHGVDVGPALDQGVDGGGATAERGPVQRRGFSPSPALTSALPWIRASTVAV